MPYLSNYDAWKLATPPEYEGPTCACCGEFLDDDGYELCEDCDREQFEEAEADGRDGR